MSWYHPPSLMDESLSIFGHLHLLLHGAEGGRDNNEDEKEVNSPIPSMGMPWPIHWFTLFTMAVTLPQPALSRL